MESNQVHTHGYTTTIIAMPSTRPVSWPITVFVMIVHCQMGDVIDGVINMFLAFCLDGTIVCSAQLVIFKVA